MKYKFDKRLLIFTIFLIIIITTILYFFLNLPKNFYKEKIITITIPEGYNSYQIANLLEKNGIISARKFLNYLNLDYDKFDFLKDKPNSVNLEGYLFPDTYEFRIREKPEKIVIKFLNNFNNKVNKEFKKEIEKQGKTIHQILIMASILEKEAKNFNDKLIISGILWKRFFANYPLQADSTYIFGNFDSYKNKGFPRKPIVNPGIESIKAAIYPKYTKYWFYFTNSDNSIIYSENYLEHQKNILKFKYVE
ncbi:MAG: endolytic transglycosylase MltG [Patescibacteria group bacterium]|nr:endolytic transglycosylase MltG [Patescibacteria group bacterium]